MSIQFFEDFPDAGEAVEAAALKVWACRSSSPISTVPIPPTDAGDPPSRPPAEDAETVYEQRRRKP